MTYFVRLPSGTIVNLDLVVLIDHERVRIAQPRMFTGSDQLRFAEGLVVLGLDANDCESLYRYASEVAMIARDAARDDAAPRAAPVDAP